MKLGRFILVSSCVVVLALAWAPRASRADDARERIVIEINGFGTRYNEGVFGETESMANSAAVLSIGERGAVQVSYDSFDEAGRPYGTLHNHSVGTVTERRKEEFIDRAPHVWWVEVRPIELDLNVIELELTWEHYRSDLRGEPHLVGGDTRHIRMKEGGRHVFDFIALDRGSAPKFPKVNVVLEVTASVEENPTLARERLSYDLWYRHTDARGHASQHRFRNLAGQGEHVEANFPPVRIPVPDTELTTGRPIDSIIESSATMQGRVRQDGRIDIRLSAGRWIGAAAPGEPRTGGTGDGGTRTVTVESGETIRLILPPPTGAYSPGGDHRGEDVWIDNPTFYADHTDELILTVTRQQ